MSNTEVYAKYFDHSSAGISVRCPGTPLPTAAQRIANMNLCPDSRSKAGKGSGKIRDALSKTYIFSTVVVLSGLSGLLHDRMTNDNYVDVSASQAILETAIVSLGGDVGIVAAREMTYNPTLHSGDGKPLAFLKDADRNDSIDDAPRNFAEKHLDPVEHPHLFSIFYNNGLIGIDAPGEVSDNSLEGMPTPAEAVSIIMKTAAVSMVSISDAAGTVEKAVEGAMNVHRLCSSDCSSYMLPIPTFDGYGLIAIRPSGEANVFEALFDGIEWSKAPTMSERAPMPEYSDVAVRIP